MADCPRDLSRAALVTNTASGRNRRRGVEDIHDRAAGAGLRHVRVDEIEALPDVLADLARRETQLIIVNAGDGTVCRLLDIVRAGGWRGEAPVLALLRGGTTNMIHDDVGWTGRPEAALAALLACLQDGRGVCRERHVLEAYQSGPDTIRRGFFFGTHAVVRAVLRTRTRVDAGKVIGGGELMTIAAMVWCLLRRRVDGHPVLSPVPVEVAHSDGVWRQAEQILLMATSLRKILLGIRPLRSGQRAGLAELSWPDYRLVPWLWRLVRGRLEALRSISLRGEFSWMLDGEIYQHRASDGVLSVTAGEPARFLVKDAPS